VAIEHISRKYYIVICCIILLEIVLVYFTYPESKHFLVACVDAMRCMLIFDSVANHTRRDLRRL